MGRLERVLIYAIGLVGGFFYQPLWGLASLAILEFFAAVDPLNRPPDTAD